MVVLIASITACKEDEEQPLALPYEADVQELADRMCEQDITCFDYGTTEEEAELMRECSVSQFGLPERLYGEYNAQCKDICFVFHECRASLGCSDFQWDPEQPGNPCHEEAQVAREASCLL